MKRSTSPVTFLLFGAPLLLMASAWWWQNREASFRHSDVGPFNLSFERVEVSPITVPSEVADGNDTEIRIILNYNGARPQWWEKRDYYPQDQWYGQDVWYSQNGKALKVDQGREAFGSTSSSTYDEKLDRFVYTVRLPLARVPRSETPVVYETTIAGAFARRGQNGRANGEKLPFPNLPIAVEVRGANEETRVAEVSRDSELRFVSAKVQNLKPDIDRPKGYTQVVVAVQNMGKKLTVRQNGESVGVQFVGLFDRAGREYSLSYRTSSHLPFDNNRQIGFGESQFSLSEIPPRVRPLYARFKATKDKSWPLPISVRVRP